ncbi:hypothetical protein BDW69DRAFT_185659 [Aspergillus filifer]
MRLPTEIMAEILQIIGDEHPIKETFAARRVNKLFRHELTKRIIRYTRLENDCFLTHLGSPVEVRDAWSDCPKSLRMAYLHHKFEQHNIHASPFSYRIDELLDYHETLAGSTEAREQVLERLLHGVLAIPYPDCMESYEALLAVSAIENGNEAEFARMIEMGVDPMLKCDTFKLSPLIIVGKHGTAEMASSITDHHRSRTMSGEKSTYGSPPCAEISIQGLCPLMPDNSTLQVGHPWQHRHAPVSPEAVHNIIRILLEGGLDEHVTVRPSTKAKSAGDELLANISGLRRRLVDDSRMGRGGTNDGGAGDLDENTDDEDSDDDESEEEQDDEAFMVLKLSKLYGR